MLIQPIHRRRTLATIVAVVATLLLSILTTVRPDIASAVEVEAGYKDQSYGSGVGAPTEDKPQSKVWFADGFWWGGLFVDGPDEVRIHRYDPTARAWIDTGVAVDDRNSSHGDYLWVGATNSLYVASVNGDSDADPILVFKYDYNPGNDTYTLDGDFVSDHDGDLDTEPGVVVGTGPAESVTIARDSTGQLWITYTTPIDPTGVVTTERKVMVNRSTDADESIWGTSFQIGDPVGEDDISAIVAFPGNVGVMWSEQRVGSLESYFRFSTHADSDANDLAWSPPESVAGAGDFSEDHINLKLTTTASGQVLAVVKTNGGPDHIQVLRRNSDGSFSRHVVVGASQPASRPQLMIDETNNVAYVFYTSPESATDPGDQAIYYKSAPLSTLDFGDGSGLGTLFIKDASNDINDVSTAKHNVTASMGGILAIASSDTNTSYYHGWIPVTEPGPGPDPELPFDDIESSPFVNDIVWVYEAGITGGCSTNPPLYCPLNNVTRGQMASFLVRALELPPDPVRARRRVLEAVLRHRDLRVRPQGEHGEALPDLLDGSSHDRLRSGHHG